ncbi:helix-turn-helix transcriptional regulator [Streptomyces sp. NPDC050264]|uniref:helix-turn-helix domain-containing protein n=1 Tax=Streptomyces sp. NPDC050264 TaxID=3155038 RepID=UPI003424F870
MISPHLPEPACLNCGSPLDRDPNPQRGRPAEYCGRPCRQAAYRDRQRRKQLTDGDDAHSRPVPAVTSDFPEQEQLQELATDTQEEFRHLSRLLTRPANASALEILEYAVALQRRQEALTAGIILLARRRHISWEVLARILRMSPETARRAFRDDDIKRRLDHYATAARPAPLPETADDEDDEPTPSSVARPLRAANQLAPVLSRLQRASGLPLRQLGRRAQVSASYLSRVLSGEAFPTWERTEKIALGLGADTEAVHKVWDDEHKRRARTLKATPPPEPAGDSTADDIGPPESDDHEPSLERGLRHLYQRGGSPSPYILSAATGGAVTPEDIRKVLHGFPAEWPMVAALIQALDGEPTFFRPHWEAATDQEPDQGPQLLETPTHRLNRMLTAFGDIHHDTTAMPPTAAFTTRRKELRRRIALAARTGQSASTALPTPRTAAP